MDGNENPSPLIAPVTKNEPTHSSQVTLRIKSSAHLTNDLTVSTERNATVEQLKENIRSALGNATQGRYLRLISSGRLMAPDTAGLEAFRLNEGSVVHAVLSVAGVRGGQQALLSRSTSSTPTRRYRGSGVGSDGLVIPRTSDDDSDSDDTEDGRERIGFDRLRAEGLSRNEITALRIYFTRHVSRYNTEQEFLARAQQRPQLQDEENQSSNNTTSSHTHSAPNDEAVDSSNAPVTNGDARTERARMEDRWMETQGPHSEFRLNLNSTNPLLASRFYNMQTVADGAASRDHDAMIGNLTNRTSLGSDRDFIWGFVLGYFLGFMMMFWVWMPSVPHKQKMGILTGLCLQMTLKMMKDTDELVED